MARETAQIIMRVPTIVKEALETYSGLRRVTLTAAVRQLVADGLRKEADALKAQADQKDTLRKRLQELQPTAELKEEIRKTEAQEVSLLKLSTALLELCTNVWGPAMHKKLEATDELEPLDWPDDAIKKKAATTFVEG